MQSANAVVLFLIIVLISMIQVRALERREEKNRMRNKKQKGGKEKYVGYCSVADRCNLHNFSPTVSDCYYCN